MWPGKGEEGYSALYVVPGEGVRIEKACVGVKWFCQMRLAVPQKLSLIGCQRVPAEVVCPSGAGTAMMRRLVIWPATQASQPEICAVPIELKPGADGLWRWEYIIHEPCRKRVCKQTLRQAILCTNKA